MDTVEIKLSALVGKDLADFRIVYVTEVFSLKGDGYFEKSYGCFKDPIIAKAYAEVLKPADGVVGEVLVLTDGEVCYKLEEYSRPIKLFDDNAIALEIKEKILAKISPAQIKILGLKDS